MSSVIPGLRRHANPRNTYNLAHFKQWQHDENNKKKQMMQNLINNKKKVNNGTRKNNNKNKRINMTKNNKIPINRSNICKMGEHWRNCPKHGLNPI